MPSNTSKLTIRYDQDTKRKHRYLVIDPQGLVSGVIYFSKQLKQIPEQVLLEIARK